jgi:hypothetical protein
MCRGEAKYFHLYVPDTGRQIHRVAPILVRVGDNLLLALFGRDGGAWNELIRGTHRTAVRDAIK